MDTLRGTFDSLDVSGDSRDYDVTDDDSGRDLPPASIGQDERRMQVRAYNFWAGLLGDHNYPSIEELDPSSLDDFGPYSVLLDFSVGIEDPAVQFLGRELAGECGGNDEIRRLSDVPPRSLLSRITDHYLQILANQAPIGFEAEFVNQRGHTILYRGILLPFSSDDETIDFIFGVINWKEMADAAAADELLLEIDQALELDEVVDNDTSQRAADPVTDWADGPGEDIGGYGNIQSLGLDDGEGDEDEDDGLPSPAFGDYAFGLGEDEEYDEDGEEEDDSSYGFASLTDHIKAPVHKASALDLENFQASPDAPHQAPVEYDFGYVPESFANQPHFAPALDHESGEDAIQADDSGEGFREPEEPVAEPFAQAGTEEAFADAEAAGELDAEADLYDCLASARELALTARSSEDRSRAALYAAVGRAYDFSLAALDAPEDYQELIAENGLEVQDRAPMTPVVKLVFGADYDKTRLTEYAAVLSHAHRLGLERGSLASHLIRAEGGIKGVIQAERRLRREESGKPAAPEATVRPALADKLRQLDSGNLADISPDGAEFALVLIRRTEDGTIEVLGEIADDIALIERAARKLID